MPLLPLLLICVGGVFCLAPLGLYLSWLAALNRRPRPTVLPGPWDFVALLCGLSGFLTAGGAVAFAGVMSNARILLRGNATQAWGVWTAEYVVWFLFAAGFILLVVGVVAGGAWVRAGSLSVYNLARPPAEAAVAAALSGCGLPAGRAGDRWGDAAGGVTVRTFDALRHVTVRVVGDDPRRREALARALARELAAAPADPTNLTAVWLGSASTILGATVAAVSVVVGYVVYVGR